MSPTLLTSILVGSFTLGVLAIWYTYHRLTNDPILTRRLWESPFLSACFITSLIGLMAIAWWLFQS